MQGGNFQGGGQGFQGFQGFNGGFQGGFQGGQFTPPGGGAQAGGMLQSGLLITLIKQTIGSPRDWGANINVNQPMIPGQPAPEPDPEYTGNWQIGYYPPARALMVKAPSRMHTNLRPPPTSTVMPPPGTVKNDGPRDDKRIAGRTGGKEDPNNPDTKIAGAGDKRRATLEELKKRLPKGDADPKTVWQDALAQGVDDPGLIIACADYMVEAGRFEHAAEFLKANLRQGIVVRPWVYEALAVALRESKASPDEVERAELSASSLEPLDSAGFLRASHAMAEQKRFDRALAYCRQAGELSPNTPQAYEEALDYAESARDSDAMIWAAGHLLGCDWPVNNQRLQTKARDSISQLAKKLDAEGQKDRAEICER